MVYVKVYFVSREDAVAFVAVSNCWATGLDANIEGFLIITMAISFDRVIQYTSPNGFRNIMNSNFDSVHLRPY